MKLNDLTTIESAFDYKKHISDSGLINEKLKGYVTGSIKKGYGINLPVLDNVIVCKTNEMYACTGKKGRGKTTIQEVFFLMWAMVHNLNFILCLQENDNSLSKMSMLGYILGCQPKDVLANNPELYNTAVRWLDERFIYLKDVDTLKEATEITECIVNDGKKIQALFCDPVNTFDSGWFDTGNTHKDDKKTAKKILNFSQKTCSVFLSQHPTMAGQRAEEDANSYSAEGGYFLNKADFTWAINRNNGDNVNRISVDNVRNKYTGGSVTHRESPLNLIWHPYRIDIEHNGISEENIFQRIRRKYNPLKEVFNFNEERIGSVPNMNVNEAFGNDDSIF